MFTVEALIDALRQIAPPALSEDWDNTGLLLGERSAAVQRVMTCLTLTPDVAEDALSKDVQLIVTHHPILFRPVQRLTDDNPEGRMLLRLIRGNVAVYSPHTSYDGGPQGINRQLAETLGLTEIRPLRPAKPTSYCKIVCFVPEGHRLPVQQALWDAGAGHIGEYSECSFRTQGIGTFRGSEAANPAIGTAGSFEEVDEVRLETIFPNGLRDRVVAAMLAAHPYEMPAYDIVPLDLPGEEDSGAGRYGRLPQPLPFGELLDRMKTLFSLPTISFAGDPAQTVRTIGVACGSAGEFLRDAHRCGCDAFVTGETRFHTYLEAETLGTGLVVIGHYASERPAIERLASDLAARFPGLSVSPCKIERDPCRRR